MKIDAKIYDKILECIPSIPPETGGILGGDSDIITNFIFDGGLSDSDEGRYYPDIDKINTYLSDWQKSGIKFYGILHSHFTNERTLSMGDRQYIKNIMMSMPTNIKELYFPIVIPYKEMVSFKAKRVGCEINIIADDIKIF
ncbi:MAG: hypothetical protein FWD82_03605 [Defluviitaleaceae bacterium]|nr:hypothetical protein [Defluviitaleaceae bacterium]